MEVESGVCNRGRQNALESEARVENVGRIRAYRPQSAVKVDCDALHLRKHVRDEVGHGGRRRHAQVNVRVSRIESPLRIVHHRAAAEYAATLTKNGALKAARTAYKCRIAKCKRVDVDDGRSSGPILVREQDGRIHAVSIEPGYRERIGAGSRLSYCLLEEQVRRLQGEILPPQSAVTTRKRRRLSSCRRGRISQHHVRACRARGDTRRGEVLRAIAEVILGGHLNG